MARKKTTLEKTARELTWLVEFLKSLPEKEQDRRADKFGKAALQMSRAARHRRRP